MRILHVENDPDSATAVRKMLEGVVDECAWTEFGETALEMARIEKYDLILLDVMLPDIDGYDVAGRLRDMEVNTPILILSGLVDRDSEYSSLAFGASDYLIKPFSRAELVKRVQAVAGRPDGLSNQARKLGPAHLGGAPPDGKESRKYRRFTTIKSARIDYGPGVKVRVVNITHAGAGLRLLEQPGRLPPTFHLVLDGGESRLCRVAWHNGDRMGVKFIDNVA